MTVIMTITDETTMMDASSLIDDIARVSPNVKSTIVVADDRLAVKVQGKGAKLVAWYWNRERYLNGDLDTDWSRVYPRHGLGYIIPFYEDPMSKIL